MERSGIGRGWAIATIIALPGAWASWASAAAPPGQVDAVAEGAVLPPSSAVPHVSIQTGNPPVAPASMSNGLGSALDPDALERLRGGEASVAVVVDNQGAVGNNTANGVVSGFNQIDDGAFANANGISTVIQNSGSNVLIQNGTAINVQFVDPGR